MFESSFLEMLVIGIVALLVIGPERLPSIAAKLGRWIAKARAFIATSRADIEREFQTEQMREMLSKQEDEIRELRDLMQQKTTDIHEDIQKPQQNIQKTLKDIQHP